jgi:hypothetical protein
MNTTSRAKQSEEVECAEATNLISEKAGITCLEPRTSSDVF